MSDQTLIETALQAIIVNRSNVQIMYQRGTDINEDLKVGIDALVKATEKGQAAPSEILGNEEEILKKMISAYARDQFDNQHDNIGCCNESMKAAFEVIKPYLKREIGKQDLSPYRDYTWEDVAMLVQENNNLKELMKKDNGSA